MTLLGFEFLDFSTFLNNFQIIHIQLYINNHVDTVSTGAHFNLPGHSQADLKITVIEQAKKKDKTYREIREEYHINKFNTYYEGLNRKQ